MIDVPSGPRVVFVNRYYWPDELATAQLLTDLAEGLAARGRSVAVVASRDRTTATPARESRHGVKIIRVRATRWSRRGLVTKALDYLTFVFAARRALQTQVRTGDWLVAMTDPPALALTAASAARRRDAHLVHWLQDIHPEISLALSGSRLLAALSRPWRRRRDAAWRDADACVAISRDMAVLVGEHGVPLKHIHVIPNWAPAGEALTPVSAWKNPLIHEWNLGGKFVVAYSGNLGRVHALEPVLAAAARLRHEPDLVFLFIGDGPRRLALEAEARAQGLANVHFLPPQPRARLAESLSVGDLHLVTLHAGCERCVFPSKLYGIAAVGRPVLYVGPPHGELAETVRLGGFGLAVPPSDARALAAAILELRRDPARLESMRCAAARWSGDTGGLPAALAAWQKLLE
jgi:glycosyltransferase involved in cell wall biosynthesis